MHCAARNMGEKLWSGIQTVWLKKKQPKSLLVTHRKWVSLHSFSCHFDTNLNWDSCTAKLQLPRAWVSCQVCSMIVGALAHYSPHGLGVVPGSLHGLRLRFTAPLTQWEGCWFCFSYSLLSDASPPIPCCSARWGQLRPWGLSAWQGKAGRCRDIHATAELLWEN